MQRPLRSRISAVLSGAKQIRPDNLLMDRIAIGVGALLGWAWLEFLVRLYGVDDGITVMGPLFSALY